MRTDRQGGKTGSPDRIRPALRRTSRSDTGQMWQGMGEAWNALSTLIAGIAVWGGIGYGIDYFVGTKPVLFVDGEAANDGAKAAPLPPLEIRVTGNDSQVTRYTLGTSSRSLAPGERFGFSSRLDVPRNGVKAVSVTFAG